MTKLQKIIIILPASLLIVLFFYFVFKMADISNDQSKDAISKEQPSENINDNQIPKVSDGNENESSDAISTPNSAVTEDKEDFVPANTIKLAVSSSQCIGCGKCARFDPEHFAMSGNKATVVSQKNLTTSALKSAVGICPTDAISLN